MRFLDTPDGPRRARESFERAGFDHRALTERLGAHAFAHVAAGELAPLLHATRGGDPIDVLARLFVLGVPISAAAARAVLAPLPLEDWVRGGVLATAGDEVTARVAIRPVGGSERWLVAHDFARPSGAGVAPDHVLGISASTMSLAGATVRRPIGSAFDLGTGCGIQALYASSHAERVVASDLNPRAVACATLTMALNGVTHVAVVRGDRFEPVAGETFDLIVANPPFVISPAQRYLFRDSGLALDEISRSIVRDAAAHLTVGGHAQLLASWAHVEGEDWRSRLEGWFAGTGCDALVLERETQEPAAHAAGWLRQTEPPDRWEPEYSAWMTYYEQHRVEAIGFGLITMRRRSAGSPWFRAESAPQEFEMPCGDQLGATFELADFLEAHPGPALLEAVLRVAPDVVLDERSRPTQEGWTPTDRRLRQTAGLRFEGAVDPAIAAIVAACDGSRPVGAVLAEAAQALDVDAARVAPAALSVLRRLVEQAFLLPVA